MENRSTDILLVSAELQEPLKNWLEERKSINITLNKTDEQAVETLCRQSFDMVIVDGTDQSSGTAKLNALAKKLQPDAQFLVYNGETAEAWEQRVRSSQRIKRNERIRRWMILDATTNGSGNREPSMPFSAN
jgi:4-hydroxy-3-methylbut-2-enyl diphosphate reductase IspH